MLTITKQSITSAKTEAIVNAANENLWPGGGVCGAIFRSAGMVELVKECESVGGCPTGQAVITPGYRLCPYIIHAVGPIYRDGKHNERKLLYSAYRHSLEVARDNHIASIAFPLISAGIYGYPLKEAWEVAIEAVEDFLKEYDIEVVFCILDDHILEVGKETQKKYSK